jgi:hypothetical protein
VFAFVVEACDAPRPRLIVTPTTLQAAGGCPGQPSYLAVFAVPDRIVPAGARPV